MPNCGTLPDFGNFCIQREGEKCMLEYDRYKGVAEMIGHAKAVSAKSYDFDAEGNETTIDYRRMMEIIRGSEYSGYIGIEYEGSRLSEMEGIAATQKLLSGLISV
jgi:hydroxypyruvate isomerase